MDCPALYFIQIKQDSVGRRNPNLSVKPWLLCPEHRNAVSTLDSRTAPFEVLSPYLM
jgi:hypothetical protein